MNWQQLIPFAITFMIGVGNWLVRRAQNAEYRKRIDADRSSAITATAVSALEWLRQAQAVSTELREQNSRQHQEMQLAALETAALVAANAELRSLLTEQRTESDRLKDQVYNIETRLTAENEELKAQIAELRDEIKRAEESAQQLRIQLQEAESRAIDLAAKLTAAETTIEQLRRRITELESHNDG